MIIVGRLESTDAVRVTVTFVVTENSNSLGGYKKPETVTGAAGPAAPGAGPRPRRRRSDSESDPGRRRARSTVRLPGADLEAATVTVPVTVIVTVCQSTFRLNLIRRVPPQQPL
jgi:hypothetical protein